MALEAPLRSSTGYMMSPFMPAATPDSPPAFNSRDTALSSTGSDSNSLRPNSFMRPLSAHLLLSPGSDIVGPSPVTSNGTETTEIEDDIAEEHAAEQREPSSHPSLMMLRTNIPDALRRSTNEEVVSVIHAPQSFQSWRSNDPTKPPVSSSLSNTVTAASLDGSLSPPPSEQTAQPQSPPNKDEPPMAPTVNTNVKPVKFGIDAPTPQAQNLQDFIGEAARLRSSSASSLELIPEHREGEDEDDIDYLSPPFAEEESEIKALWTALEECWTLCNTLANLSSIHRVRVFNNSGTPDAHEKAWKCCWKLCKRLYNSRDDRSESFNVRTILDLCRDFCQALFEVRQRTDGVADSVLRVSFELNNHLYSAQDSRNLPEAFRERTLDFYITLCHRLMKQRSELAEETGSLLRACWGLAEMLFNLRQNRRHGKVPDAELLSSAVQACWELCDIFREGWTQIRPDRGTPRPSHVNFFSQGMGLGSPPSVSDRHSDRLVDRLPDRHSDRLSDRHQMQLMQAEARSNAGSRSSMHSMHSLHSNSKASKRDSLRSLSDVAIERERERPQRKHAPVPETPVTEFEDTPISPESASPQIPNIMVLGTSAMNDARSSGRGGGWSSSASNLSGYSQGSQKTSSTATTATATIEDSNITRIKVLVVKAAMNIGFNRDTAPKDSLGELVALQGFVKSLPTGSFGSLPTHATLLQHYKNLVLADNSFRVVPTATLPSRGKRVHSQDIAKSVGWMMVRSQGQYGFLRDLFKLVFGFPVEDADRGKIVTIAV